MKESQKNSLDMLKFEKEYKQKGYNYIAGVDEVGRGPLAGPVVTCAIIMDLNKIIDGVNDSKKLSIKKREELYHKILDCSVAYKISQRDEKCIDEINILEATKLCMADSINGLNVKPDIVFIDAVNLKNTKFEILPIIKGDAKSYTIACASIVAKVYRDKLMDDYHKIYPEYNFIKNKGYGTAEHIDALKKIGACEIHRKSFIKHFVG